MARLNEFGIMIFPEYEHLVEFINGPQLVIPFFTGGAFWRHSERMTLAELGRWANIPDDELVMLKLTYGG